MQSPDLIERAAGYARSSCEQEIQPQKDALALTHAALQENQARIDQMLDTLGTGQASGALFAMLNEKAARLQREGEQLRAEQRRLTDFRTLAQCRRACRVAKAVAPCGEENRVDAGWQPPRR